MKRKSILIVLSMVFFFGLFAANLFAQDQDKQITPDKPAVQEQRVIEEELVLSDPTVAKPKKWLIGLSGEYWYVSQKWDRYYADGDKYSWGSINGSMPGGTLSVGYDMFTLSYSYRKGSWDGDSTISARANSAHQETQSILNSDQTEHEILGRFLFKGANISPYFLIGYQHLTRSDNETIITPGTVWSNNHNSNQLKSEYTFKSPLIGLGAIIPFNKYLGMRVDGRLLCTFAEFTRSDGYTATGTGAGAALVGTFYWNIWEGLNVQVGGKYQYMDGGKEIGGFYKYGAFGMLGYVFKF